MRSGRWLRSLLCAGGLLCIVPGHPRVSAQQLAPTIHPALPSRLSDYWLVPDKRERPGPGADNLGSAAKAFASGDYAVALRAANDTISADGPLREYGWLYRAQSQVRLARVDDAIRSFDELLSHGPAGYLGNAANIGKAEALAARGDQAGATAIFAQLAEGRTIAPDEVLLRLGQAAFAAGDNKSAADALLRVYYEYPLSDAAATAATLLATVPDQPHSRGYQADLGRAQMLFGGRRYSDARDAFRALRDQASGDDREIVDLRLAECDYFLGRYTDARDALEPYTRKGARIAEARFFYLSAVGRLGDEDRYIALSRALLDEFPDTTWAGDALNNLGTHYILEDEDAEAAQTFRELYERFPSGPHAQRAAWKYGWWSYRNGEYAETVRVFESAAAGFPRSDYRPSYLYWSARAHAQLGDRDVAEERLALVSTDYLNSYYGRLAERRLSARRASRTTQTDGDVAVPAAARTTDPPAAPDPSAAPDPPPNAPVIKRLLAAGLYDNALNELRYAQKVWGTSAPIEATIAWTYNQKGELRRAITLMRRAYPQHLAAGGEDLPPEILQVIFPLTYWDSIRKYARAHDLDPYVVAALIAQESTFDPNIRSAADAWGLMQILPSTGRRLARRLGVRRWNRAMLTNPVLNIRMGTLYFSDLVEQFGGTYYALASYNAGENRVARWKEERPGLDEDEFIDDIPFPETQNYVKRILGTAEDYRRLYGPSGTIKPGVSKTSATKGRATKKKPSGERDQLF
ncbi:MAG TPA: transglycosylase SLT domain-containing protein [Vicinamibacterales bacterium]|nr:transglycosylase SLT domain-containing protein [Vicinamibacterales bacterium]